MLILDYDYEMDIAVQREEAAKEGHQEGFKRGHQEGIEQGVFKRAKNLKELGIAIDVITEATGLTNEQIEKI